ncbi:MAG: DUF2807 domain-containing protein [Sphingobacteriales bacterium]|nr:DUF2807 domain-containing protein [Sphingobacteriales bacterium]
MKKISFSFLLVAFLAFFSSCDKVVGDGPVVQQVIPVTDFSKLSVAIHGRVNYAIGPVYKVEVMAQQNIIDVMQFIKEGDELVIKFQNGVWVRKHEDIVVNITAPLVKSVNLSGSAAVSVTGPVTGNLLDLKVSGSGDLEVQQAAISDKLTGTISGSGSLTVYSGTTVNESLQLSGSGNMNLTGLQSDKASTHISGSGNIRVKVAQTLDAHISGSGSVYYLGSPVITSHVSGSGRVRAL